MPSILIHFNLVKYPHSENVKSVIIIPDIFELQSEFRFINDFASVKSIQILLAFTEIFRLDDVGKGK